MSAKGKARQESEGYVKQIGIENFKPLKFNPTKDELSELLDTDIENEPVYTGKKDKDGNDMSFITLWAQGEKSDKKFPIKFILINKERLNKEGVNYQWINSVGEFQWAKDESTLFDSFTNFTQVLDWKGTDGEISKRYKTGSKPNQKTIGAQKTYRKAYVGEEELYSFLRAWLKFDYYDEETELSFNIEDLLAGDVDELNKLIDSEYSGEVIAVATVRNVEKDGETNQYQGVSTKAFLPGSLFKYVVLGNFPRKLQGKWKAFTDAFGGEYGEKAFYSLDVIHDYDENEDLAASNVAIKEEDASY